MRTPLARTARGYQGARRRRTATRRRPPWRGIRASATAACAAVALALTGCGTGPLLHADTDRLQVITTTGILADLVKNVGGKRVDVASIVPNGADPHTYEPTLRDARNTVYADVAFSNYALLEEHNIIKTLDSNLPKDSTNVSIVEESAKYSAELISLVENVHLDTIWLGLRAQGSGTKRGANRASDVLVQATGMKGPGNLYAYLTGTFGDTQRYFDSSDGFDSSGHGGHDTATLPADAHTHLSWAFTKPGIYHLHLRSKLRNTKGPQQDLGKATITFAVGVNPSEAGKKNAVVLDQGHADITTDVDKGDIGVLYDPTGGGAKTQKFYDAEDVIVEVPNKALQEIPGDSQYRFLGSPGKRVFQLAQAVLGKHVHGEIDPHLWQNVRNVQSYVKLIRDTLIQRDPDGESTYRANTERYLKKLERTDSYVRTQIKSIPKDHRYLVSTHDAFAYLEQAYDITVAGFVTPNPASEPSLDDRRKLTDTLRNLHVRAVFLEPNLKARTSDLTQVAREQKVQVCPIYGDTLDDDAPTYVDMMRFNADSLKRCLGG